MPRRTVFFATNCALDAATGGFADTLDPDRPDILRAGSIECHASANPAKDGRLASRPVLASPETPDAGVAAVLAEWLGTAEKEAREPLLIVHGYQHSFADAMIRGADVCAWYGQPKDAPGFLPFCLAWPSAGGISPADYRAARARALPSGAALWRLLLAIARTRAVTRARKPLRPHYLAQSMGVLVTRFAMQHALRPGADSFPGSGDKPALPHPILGQAFLMGADDSKTVFNDVTPSADHEQPAGALRPFADHVAAAVSVAVFPPDATTRWVGPVAHPGKRISAHGAEHPEHLPANAAIVDYAYAAADYPGPTDNEMTWNWHGHQYYRNQPRVRADILAAIRAGGLPQHVPGRRPARKQPYGLGEKTGRLYVV